MSEQQAAAKVQQELTETVTQARETLAKGVHGLLSALDAVQRHLEDATALARKWNLTQGQTLRFDERFILDGIETSDRLRRLVESLAIKAELAPQPGVRVTLDSNCQWDEYPRGATVVLSLEEVRRIENRERTTRGTPSFRRL